MNVEAIAFHRALVPLFLIGALLNVFAVTGLKATTWSASTGGDLLTSSNWTGGNAPNGTDAVAAISTQPTNVGNFSLSGTMTLGELDYSNFLARSITGAGILNLDVSSGTPEISVTSGNLTIGTLISGSDGLNKSGASALTLINSSNNYTGTTTISAGTLTVDNSTGSATGSSDITINTGATLSIGSGFSTGAVSGIITDNGTLRFNRSSSLTYSNPISGTGALLKDGAGTLTLTGNNTFTGGTTLDNGILSLGSSGVLGTIGTISFPFSSNGLQWTASNTTDYSSRFSTAANQHYVFDTNGQNITLASALTSSGGSLFKIGNGTLMLSGANTYNGAGGTTVSGGTVAGTTTSLQRNITNNAAVTFNQAPDGTYSGNMSGTGSLTKQGTGNVTLSGTNSYSGGTTISGGTLTGTTSSLQGSIVDNAAVAFNQSAAGTYSGNISGIGSFTKLGTGNLTLAGTNSYSGGTTVSAGTLTGTTSSLQGNITDNAALVFDQSTTGTYDEKISGTGSLAKQGTGSVTVSNINTYSGGTNINGGTLIVPSDSRLGDPTGGITLGGGALRSTFSFSSARNITVTSANGSIDPEGGDLTLTGLISGAGKLTISYTSGAGGGGAVILTNTNNTYSGGTVIKGSVLRISADSSLGDPSSGISLLGVLRADADFTTARAITLDNASGIVTTSGIGISSWGHNITLSGPISGPGGLGLYDDGTITLSNSANNYSGGTYIGATVMISSDANLGAPTGSLTLGGHALKALANFTISGSRSVVAAGGKIDTNGFDVTIPGQISGSSSVVKTGDGTLTLTNTANSCAGLTISGGVVEVAADTILGAVTGRLGFLGGTLRTTASFSSNRYVNFGTPGGTINTAGNDLALNGTVSFGGGLTKIGAGTLTLGSNSEFGSDGPVTLNDGTLMVSNTIGSATGSGSITINSGGRLAGTGRAGGNVTNGGTVTPGNSPGTLTIGGSYTQSAGGKLQIEIASSSSFDHLNIGGAATLAGTLEVLLTGGYMPAAGTQFDILDFGSATGTFDSLLLPTLDASLRWNTAGLYANGALSVTFAGDFNGDFNVDTADYVVWRKTDGSQAGYDAWRSKFGQPPGSGASISANAAVPEPTTLMLLLFAATFWCLRRNRTA